jgi:CRP-like cAMP-binding protein
MPVKSTPDIRPFLRRLPYFSGLNEQTLDEVARSAYFQQYAAGQLVVLEGEPPSGLYIVLEGWLKASKIALDGREQILQFLEDEDVFNAIGVFSGEINPATVTALEPSAVWLVRRETVLRLLDTHPQFARLVIQDLAGRVVHLIALVEDLSLRSVEARLARLLLENAAGGRVQRKRWATQTEIASRLGTVPDVVSRTLRRLAERGLIQISRQEIILVDRAGLEAAAQIEQ